MAFAFRTARRLATVSTRAKLEEILNIWNEPEATEIKVDAEISSYQDDTFDPMRDGPLFVEAARPPKT